MAGTFAASAGMAKNAGNPPAQRTVLVTISDTGKDPANGFQHQSASFLQWPARTWRAFNVTRRCACAGARLFARSHDGWQIVRLGDQTGSPNANFEGPVREIFAELDKTIKAVGGSGLKDMVTMTVFINDVRLGDRLAEIRKETFKECFPGSALITVSGFARPGLLIEIQGMAVIGAK